MILNIYTTVDLAPSICTAEPGEEAPILHSCPAIISSSTITLHTADTSLYLYLRGGRARTQHGGGNGLDNCADVQVAGPGQLHPSTAPAMCHPVITNITLSYCHAVIQLHYTAVYCHTVIKVHYTHHCAGSICFL